MPMQLNLLKPGALVKARMLISPEKAKHWKHAATNSSVGGGLMPGTQFRVVQVSTAPPFARLEIPGRSPPAFLTLTGEELAMNFDMFGGATAAPTPPGGPRNLAAVFQQLSRRQMIVGSGLEAMRAARTQLQKDIATGKFWGGVGIVANALLLPLNVIINAFELKGATTAYQALVKEAYAQLSKSGTRIDSKPVKTGLSIVKKAAVETLAKQGLKHYIPGVNIIIGVAEDGFALFEVASTVSEGSNEMRALLRQADAKIDASYRQFIKLGIEMDRLLTEMQRRARTA